LAKFPVNIKRERFPAEQGFDFRKSGGSIIRVIEQVADHVDSGQADGVSPVA
jgi:hypothetical protein